MDELVDKAAKINVEVSKLNKELTRLKDEIKEKGIGTHEGSEYNAIVEKRVRSRTFNQNKALAIVKKIGAKWLLTEIVDEDKLEDAIASGEIDGKDFADCIETKYNTVLTFKNRRGKIRWL